MSDPDFVMDLKIISAELDLSKYINPKSSCFLKLIKKAYTINQEQEIKKILNDLTNNKDKMQELINLEKKIIN